MLVIRDNFSLLNLTRGQDQSSHNIIVGYMFVQGCKNKKWEKCNPICCPFTVTTRYRQSQGAIVY